MFQNVCNISVFGIRIPFVRIFDLIQRFEYSIFEKGRPDIRMFKLYLETILFQDVQKKVENGVLNELRRFCSFGCQIATFLDEFQKWAQNGEKTKGITLTFFRISNRIFDAIFDLIRVFRIFDPNTATYMFFKRCMEHFE